MIAVFHWFPRRAHVERTGGFRLPRTDMGGLFNVTNGMTVCSDGVDAFWRASFAGADSLCAGDQSCVRSSGCSRYPGPGRCGCLSALWNTGWAPGKIPSHECLAAYGGLLQKYSAGNVAVFACLWRLRRGGATHPSCCRHAGPFFEQLRSFESENAIGRDEGGASCLGGSVLRLRPDSGPSGRHPGAGGNGRISSA